MFTITIVCGIIVYVIGCYVIIGGSLMRSPGPAGLGCLLIPFAPLLPPLWVGMVIHDAFKRVFRVFS